MKMRAMSAILRKLLMLAVFCPLICSAQTGLDYVDPTIGGVGLLLQPCRPTVHLPNQMIRWTPLRADMLDDQVASYPLIMLSHRTGQAFGFLPLTGTFGKEMFQRRQEYDHERNTPYQYTAELEGCRLAFTPSKKSGIVRVDFLGDQQNFFRFSNVNEKGVFQLTDARTVTCEADFSGMKVYLYACFDHDLSDARYESDAKRVMIAGVGQGKEQVMMRYGISYVSLKQAQENLEHEIPQFDFNKVCDAAKQTWEPIINLIRVSGGTESHRRVFYTALYRCFERMVDINEYGQYYSSFDHKVHKSKEPFFTDNWIWDQHVCLEPLHTILNPDQEVQKINSYLEMYRQSGAIPQFAILSGEMPGMTGNYSAAWMADSWFKGLKFDLKTAYEGLRHNALERTRIAWRRGERSVLDDFYDEHGYFPGLKPGEKETVPEVQMPWERRQSVSITTTFSYCDWCMAQLARELKKKDDVNLFLRYAAFYRNLYRPDKHLFWPKDAEGNWIEGMDPRYMDRAYYTENNAYTFQWDVKHDIQGLADLMGGRQKAQEQLDLLFRIPLGKAKYEFWPQLPDATGMIGQFAMGNEPSFHIPYLYDYLGAPWKTQKRIHMVIDSQFNDTWYGIPGDEDGGGMSSFLVFSMMGFFPVTPGIPVYAIGSPFFEKAVIQLPAGGRTFTVDARNYSEDNKYIQRATLNGKELTRPWFTHEELMRGGTLLLEMGSEPNRAWGADEKDAPPSDINYVNK
ncbi:MAG: GH92 family glycosyl hydrolase [Bacteroidaceae bacterium]|nr:GH92 family glycosyl hydrolase [Bacteroidaceae bacterium]